MGCYQSVFCIYVHIYFIYYHYVRIFFYEKNKRLCYLAAAARVIRHYNIMIIIIWLSALHKSHRHPGGTINSSIYYIQNHQLSSPALLVPFFFFYILKT